MKRGKVLDKLFFTKLLLILFINPLLAQKEYSFHPSQIQFEALGPAGLFSINIDSRFAKKENGIGFRIGLGGSTLGSLGESCNSGAQISFPVGINYLIGKKQSLLELGGGAVLAIISGTKIFCTDIERSFFSDETVSYGYLLAGYRFQSAEKKKLTYRIFISPLFQEDFPMKFWGGVSIGYRF